MTEEPYRWLEAIQNRREYIKDHLKGATPVFAASRPEGILLLGVGHGQSKVFEIYDRHAFAALGHPVDIEKVRQSAIEAAHLEGFNRSSRDVTLRRLVGFSLSPTLKNSFEQIFSPPLIVESLFAELGETPSHDSLARLHFEGNHQYETGGVVVAYSDRKVEAEARAWVQQALRPEHGLRQVALVLLTAWRAVTTHVPFTSLAVDLGVPAMVEGRMVEVALLDRRAQGPVHYRRMDFAGLPA
ncbi:MAG TPA: 20S proteasome subunit A/B [Verrucomicrobiales bacterium]|nr:20S proteasome subunit A/B [Verrucomicrobiales bacterium]